MDSALKFIQNMNKPAPNPRHEFCSLFNWALTPKQTEVILNGWMPIKIELNSRKMPENVDIIELYDRVVKEFDIRPIVHSDDFTPAAVFHFSVDNYFVDDSITSLTCAYPSGEPSFYILEKDLGKIKPGTYTAKFDGKNLTITPYPSPSNI